LSPDGWGPSAVKHDSKNGELRVNPQIKKTVSNILNLRQLLKLPVGEKNIDFKEKRPIYIAFKSYVVDRISRVEVWVSRSGFVVEMSFKFNSITYFPWACLKLRFCVRGGVFLRVNPDLLVGLHANNRMNMTA
jgi:hypothetical protein